MEVIVNKHLIRFFEENHLFSCVNGIRFKEGEKVCIPNEGYMEEYSSFNCGNILCQIGSFSY
ncbi:hypothetical protein [Campylobacter estrildidarum]|uniref:Uncharacterized protein n=1 Tax=Campylobacter estrildidarum TaxID=2510189 RepID=A0A4U7BPF2_9BACT|nr:hypothetical protein [Campylobacter estrildidarum]TKX32155.1 hypothetical protein CQA69_01195 [Campylobacter estrildidarum]